MKKVFPILTAMALTLGACNSNDDPDNGMTQFADLVTLESSSASGVVMTFREIDDSPLVTITSTLKTPLDEKIFPTGCRMLARYQQESKEHAVSGPVNLIAVGKVLGAGHKVVPAVPDTIDNYSSNPVIVREKSNIWRTGTYVNMFVELYTGTWPKKFLIYVDEATIGTEYPELHVVFKSADGSTQKAAQLYASFNMADVWNNPNTKGVKINYITSDYGTTESKTFEKESTEPIKPTPNPGN